MPNQKTVSLINGSPHGAVGNTAVLFRFIRDTLKPLVNLVEITLTDSISRKELVEMLEASDGFIFGTGTYWDSWGSPLQKFLEDLTDTEGSSVWLGKPAAVVVSMHAVGGKGVLSRLQAVLNTFGAQIPPMSGIVCSLANQLAIQDSPEEATRDLWRPADLEIVCHNIIEAVNGSNRWKTWELDGKNFKKVWVEIET